MPISSPMRPVRVSSDRFVAQMYNRRMLSCCLLAFVSFAVALAAPAQTLAHPNWVGNGMSTDPWWQHAVIYRVHGGPDRAGEEAKPPDFRFLGARINAIRSIGIDALLLPAPPVPGQGSPETQGPAVQSDIDQLDDLVRVASGRGVRVLLTLNPASTSVDLSGIARFWLNRGIAGFHVTTPPSANPGEALAMVQSLRRLTAGAVGQRIVISDLDASTPESSGTMQPPAPVVRRSGGGHVPRNSDVAPQLQLDSRLDRVELNAASLESALSRTAGQLSVLVDPGKLSAVAAAGGHGSLSQVVATLSLLTQPAAIIDSAVNLILDPTPEHAELADAADQPGRPAAVPPAPGVYLPYKPYVPPPRNRPEPAQPAPKDPLTAWYKQLAALHHGNLALRSGNPTFLDFQAQNSLVWFSRPNTGSGGGAPVVIACNISGAPVQLSLRGALESAGLRGNYLRTLLRSDSMMGPQEVGAITLPPYGVFVGELRR